MRTDAALENQKNMHGVETTDYQHFNTTNPTLKERIAGFVEVIGDEASLEKSRVKAVSSAKPLRAFASHLQIHTFPFPHFFVSSITTSRLLSRPRSHHGMLLDAAVLPTIS